MQEKDFWEQFLKGKVYIILSTLEESVDFLKKCEDRDILWISSQKASEFNPLVGVTMWEKGVILYCVGGGDLTWSTIYSHFKDGPCVKYSEIFKSDNDDTIIKLTSDSVKTVVGELFEKGKLVKTSKSRCNPDDKFDTYIGAKLALERLFEKEIVKFKAGDRVKFKSWEQMVKEYGLKYSEITIDLKTRFVKNMEHLCGTYATVESTGEDNYVMLKDFTTQGSIHWYYKAQMLELATDEPNGYYGKIVCTSSCSNAFTVGKVYIVKDGEIKHNHGVTKGNMFKSLGEINTHFASKFVEFLGEACE